MSVEIERVFLDGESAFGGDAVLPALDFRIVEFLDTPAVDADQMVVVTAAVDLEDGFAGLEEMALQQPGLLELGQYTR